MDAPLSLARPLLAALLLAAAPAHAVPPVLPSDGVDAFVAEYMRATETNDLQAYSQLFAPEAVACEMGACLGREAWLASPHFTSYRRTRFGEVFAGGAIESGKVVTRVVFVVATQNCHPRSTECFTKHRTDIVTLEGDKIVRLETSGDLSQRRTGPGAWTIFDDAGAFRR